MRWRTMTKISLVVPRWEEIRVKKLLKKWDKVLKNGPSEIWSDMVCLPQISFGPSIPEYFVPNTSQGQKTLPYFKLFLTNKTINDIVLESNRYRNRIELQKSLKKTWKATAKEEISAFFSLTIAMGIVKLSEIRDYWKSKDIFHMPWFASIISWERFEEISRYLYLADNENKQQETHLILINYTDWEYYHINLVYNLQQCTYPHKTCR